MREADSYNVANALMIVAVHSECVPIIEHLVESGLVDPFAPVDVTHTIPQTVKDMIDESFDDTYDVPMINISFTAVTAAAMLKHARAPEAGTTKLRRYEMGYIDSTWLCGEKGDAALAAEMLEDHIARASEQCANAAEHRQLTRVILEFVARSSPSFRAACSPMWLRALSFLDNAPYFLAYVASAGVPFPSTDKFLDYFDYVGAGVSSLHKIAELGLGDAWLRVLPAAEYIFGHCRVPQEMVEYLDLLLQYGNQTMQDSDWVKLLNHQCNAQTQLPTRVLHAVPAHVWEAHMRQHGTDRMHRSSQLHVGKLLFRRALKRQRCPVECTAAGPAILINQTPSTGDE